jgi:hypothetical protein
MDELKAKYDELEKKVDARLNSLLMNPWTAAIVVGAVAVAAFLFLSAASAV